MNPVWGHVAGLSIILMMSSFIGIWIWAWNSRHRHTFDELSRVPMQDTEDRP